MRKMGPIAVATLLLAGFGACTDPNPHAPVYGDAAPSFDGGFLGGSGNSGIGKDSATVNTSSTVADSTGRGGFLGGSGN